MSSEGSLSLPDSRSSAGVNNAVDHSTVTHRSGVIVESSAFTGSTDFLAACAQQQLTATVPLVDAAAIAVDTTKDESRVKLGDEVYATVEDLSPRGDPAVAQQLTANPKSFPGKNSKRFSVPFGAANNRSTGVFPAGGARLWPPNTPVAPPVVPLASLAMAPQQLYQPPVMVPAMIPNVPPLIAPFMQGMGHLPPPPQPPVFAPLPAQCGLPLFHTAPNGPHGMPAPAAVVQNPPDLALFQPRSLDGNMAALKAPQAPPVSMQNSLGLTVSAANAKVTVGNATLAAHVSCEPPKFSCVLLSGLPAVGKTTMGRELVKELQADGFGWVFFSGADFVTTSTTKQAVWETTKDVFDALEGRLEQLLQQQREKRDLKGLVIDKNVKNVEDIFYLAALLRSKGVPFVGIVGMEADDNEVLLDRMGGGEEFREKLKHHRVIHSRIRSLAKKTAMYREIDASKDKQEVLNALRTKVLGCCAQPPQGSILPNLYVRSASVSMVDDYAEYYAVLTRLFDLLRPSDGSSHISSTTKYTPLSTRDLVDPTRVNAIKESYGARRFNRGIRHLLLYDKGSLYLIPTHHRAILRLSLKTLLSDGMVSAACAVLEGDLVRSVKVPQTEIFLVFDVLFWSGFPEPTYNIVAQMSLGQRQALLSTHLCSESNVHFPAGVDCVVAHRPTLRLEDIPKLLEPGDFPSEGIIFQLVSPSSDPVKTYLWRTRSAISVDFRLGALKGVKEERSASDSGELGTDVGPATPCDPTNPGTAAIQSRCQSLVSNSSNPANQSAVGSRDSSALRANDIVPTRIFELEVYDKQEREYLQFSNCTVEVRHPDVVEGCICSCTLADKKGHKWAFQDICYDVLRPAYKRDVTSLLEHSIIPEARLLQWLVGEKIIPPPPSDTVPRMATPSAPRRPALEKATNSIPPVPPHAPPTYASALWMKKAEAQPKAAEGDGATSVAFLETVGAFGTSSGQQPEATRNMNTRVDSLCQGTLLSQPSGHVFGRPPQGPATTAFVTKVEAGSIDAPSCDTRPTAVAASLPLTEELQLLRSIVSSVRIARKDESPVGCRFVPDATYEDKHQFRGALSGGGTGGRGSAPRGELGGNGVLSEGEDERVTASGAQCCMWCRCERARGDLRPDFRNNLYCSACWVKMGWETCHECHGFKKGYRERTRLSVGEFYCDDCWKVFEGQCNLKQDGWKGEGKERERLRERRKPKRQLAFVDAKDGAEDIKTHTSSVAVSGKDGKAKRRGSRAMKNDGRDTTVAVARVGTGSAAEGTTGGKLQEGGVSGKTSRGRRRRGVAKGKGSGEDGHGLLHEHSSPAGGG